MSKLSNNGNNLNAAPPFGGTNRLNRVENIHREWRCRIGFPSLILASHHNFVLGPISTEPPSPPPNLFGNHYIYTPIAEPVIPFNQDKGDDNDTQATPLDFCGQEYTASSPGMNVNTFRLHRYILYISMSEYESIRVELRAQGIVDVYTI